MTMTLPLPKTNYPAYGVVDKAIAPHQPGRIKFQGTYWKAELANPNYKRIEAGELIQVVGLRGITWLVIPEENGHSF
jgi:membrane protein implicated in regulation of membrane protease activity